MAGKLRFFSKKFGPRKAVKEEERRRHPLKVAISLRCVSISVLIVMSCNLS